MAQVNLGHVVGPGIPSGGTTGQILKKASGTNFDTAWMDAGQLPEVTGLASDLADEFNASTVYQEGDFCTNGATLYKRNSWGGSTPAAEAWDATHWTAVNVTDEIQDDRTAIAGEASTRAAADTALGTDVANLRSDLGIVENTNTATHTIAAGQYVIWKGLLYTASSAIPSGTTLSSSNLTAVSSGGLNSLNGKITTQTVSGENVLANVPSTITITTNRTYLKRCANVVDLLIFFKPTANGTIAVGNLPSVYVPAYNLYLSPVNNSEDKPEGNCIITSGGIVNVYGVVANKEYAIHATYIM